MMKLKIVASAMLVAAVLASPSVASAQVTYLDFEGIATYPTGSGVQINDFYNGGTASNGASGANFGVQFVGGATLLCLNTAAAACSNTSRGGLGIPTSQFYALYFPNTNPTMNVAAGFTNGLSFTYASPFAASTVNIYSGLNGTGTLLASTALPLTTTGACDPTIAGGAQYCPFSPFSVGFSGTAQSVTFGGSVNSQVFDDFTFGSTVVGGAVPEPASWGLMILGFGVVGGAMRYRRRATRVAFAA